MNCIAMGHLIEGAVAYYEATGKDKLLKAACSFCRLCRQLILDRKKENARAIRDMRLQRWHWYVSMR